MKKSYKEDGFAHPVGLLVVVIVVALVGFTGFRVSKSNNPKTQLNNSEQVSNEQEVLPLNLEGLLEINKVKELATASGTATVVGLELENEKGLLIYEVKLSDGSVIALNARTGERVNSTDDDNDEQEEDDALPANFTINISFEKAREIAQAKFPDSTIRKIQLDVEEGIVVLSVRFTDKARVDVDAANGSIVRTKSPKQSERDNNSSQSRSGTNSGSSNSGSGSDNTEDSDDSEDGSDEDSTDDPDEDDSDDLDDDSGSNSGSGSTSSGSGSR